MTSLIHIEPVVFVVAVDDILVSNSMNKFLISIKIVNDFGSHATASLTFDDSNGQLIIPNTNSPVSIGLGWTDSGPVNLFSRGIRLESFSKGSRSHGRTLTVNLTGADLTATGIIKSQSDQYADNMTFQDVANKFAPSGWSTVVKGGIASLHREYWSLNNQTFPNWLNKIATEVGGQVICSDKKFVVIPVGSNVGIPFVECDCGPGGNVIEWDIVPDSDLLDYKSYQTLNYDNAAATLLGDMGDTSGGTVAINKAKAPDASQAETQSAANKSFGTYELKRGTLILVGEPSCAVGGIINLNGSRRGVDGFYHIKHVEHEYTRAGGFRTTLELRNPLSTALPAGDFTPPT
jgi:phage protein D